MKRAATKQITLKQEDVAPATSPSVFWVVIVLGFGLRLLVSAVSIGSNDAAAFFQFANHVFFRGLFTAYRENIDLNHPPIPAYFSAGVLWFCNATGLDSITWYFFLFKLPGIAADGLSAFLLYRIWKKRGGRTNGLAAAAIYSAGLGSILVSGYHGNTDTVYACLSLLAVYLMQDKRRPFLGGLALAGAINVKLIPCLLIPVLLLSLRRRRDVVGFLGGLAIGVIPYIPPLVMIGPQFYHNALSYTPGANRWGILLPFLWWRSNAYWLQPEEGFAYYYNWNGRFLIFGLVAIWSVVTAKLRQWNRYESAAVVYALFLIFAPGFGVQYTVVIAPLMLATPVGRRRVAVVYYTSAGLLLLMAYWIFWDGLYPFGSDFRNYLPHEAAAVGGVVWLTLVWFLVQTLRRPSRKPDEEDTAPLADKAAASVPITR